MDVRESLQRAAVAFHRRPFGRVESAFYESVAAPAVRAAVAPLMRAELDEIGATSVLDVGCGGGALTRDLATDTRSVIGVDPSLPQVRRASRAAAGAYASAAAAGLPVRSGAFDAVVASCSVKHWPDAARGLVECARALRAGGRLVIVEVDGAADRDELVRFAATTRIPPGLRWLYPRFADRTLIAASPTLEGLVRCAESSGFAEVTPIDVDGLPFVALRATR